MPFDEAYAEAMGDLVERYPDDLDAATLYAASLMNLSPWDYWNLDGSPKENTTEILDTLQSVVDRDPRHAGALHYYIHTVEARHPGRGEQHADMLTGLMPGAGHMVHMPSHIYMRLGRFADSYEVNRQAVEADEGYIAQCRAQGIYPLNYYPHNIHFMAWSAMVQGRKEAAMAAARKIVEEVPPEIASNKNVWALYETFLSQPMFIMVRFGMWSEMPDGFRITSHQELPAQLEAGDGIWDLHPDEERFLAVRLLDTGESGAPIVLVTNWFEELRQRMGN